MFRSAASAARRRRCSKCGSNGSFDVEIPLKCHVEVAAFPIHGVDQLSANRQLGLSANQVISRR